MILVHIDWIPLYLLMILVYIGLILSKFYVRLGFSWFILDGSSSTSVSDLNETHVYMYIYIYVHIYVYVTDPPLSLYPTEIVLNYVWLILLCLCILCTCIRLGCSWSICGWSFSFSASGIQLRWSNLWSTDPSLPLYPVHQTGMILIHLWLIFLYLSIWQRWVLMYKWLILLWCVSDWNDPDPPVADLAGPADGGDERGLPQVLRHQQGRQVREYILNILVMHYRVTPNGKDSLSYFVTLNGRYPKSVDFVKEIF